MNIKKLTEELDIYPSKKLGQNFLIHENTAKKILDWANIPKGSNVAEIGPGLGALTFELINRGYHLHAIEKDKRLFSYLETKMNPENISNADVLEFEFDPLFKKEEFYVISNAPYSISTPIIEKILEIKDRVPEMVFLFQEEVIDRICATPGNKNYGRLSIWIQSQCEIERGPRISRENFYPKPDVESRLVRMTPSFHPLVPKKEAPEFLKWVARIFQQRRKTLRKNLKDMGYASEVVQAAFFKAQLSDSLRAEVVDIKMLFKIFELLQADS